MYYIYYTPEDACCALSALLQHLKNIIHDQVYCSAKMLMRTEMTITKSTTAITKPTKHHFFYSTRHNHTHIHACIAHTLAMQTELMLCVNAWTMPPMGLGEQATTIRSSPATRVSPVCWRHRWKYEAQSISSQNPSTTTLSHTNTLVHTYARRAHLYRPCLGPEIHSRVCLPVSVDRLDRQRFFHSHMIRHYKTLSQRWYY